MLGMYQWCRGPLKWVTFQWCKERHQLLVAQLQDRLALLQQDRASLTVPLLLAQLQDTDLLRLALLQQDRVLLTVLLLLAQLQDTDSLRVAFPRLGPRSSLLTSKCKVYHTPAYHSIHLASH